MPTNGFHPRIVGRFIHRETTEHLSITRDDHHLGIVSIVANGQLAPKQIVAKVSAAHFLAVRHQFLAQMQQVFALGIQNLTTTRYNGRVPAVPFLDQHAIGIIPQEGFPQYASVVIQPIMPAIDFVAPVPVEVPHRRDIR